MFYLGVHRPNWLATAHVRLFISRSTLRTRKSFPRAAAPWALDSGGFTELSRGGWTLSAEDYAREVWLYRREIGHLEWVAPQDWMCEPTMLAKTGLSIPDHQHLTVDNFLRLRDELGTLVVPVLQGWSLDDYLRCIERYESEGVDLQAEWRVGVGSVCRRQGMGEAGGIFRRLHDEGLALHGFGVKKTGLSDYAAMLASADSMAWSVDARWDANHGIPSCNPSRRRSCANCLHFAMEWRRVILAEMEDALCAA